MITMASDGYYILLRNSKIMKNISEDENNGARQYLGNYLWLALTLCDSVFILVIWDSLYHKLLLCLQQACCLIFFIVVLCFIFSVLLFIIIIVLFFIYFLTPPWKLFWCAKCFTDVLNNMHIFIHLFIYAFLHTSHTCTSTRASMCWQALFAVHPPFWHNVHLIICILLTFNFCVFLIVRYFKKCWPLLQIFKHFQLSKIFFFFITV